MNAITELPHALLPAVIFDGLVTEGAFDPFAHCPLFDPPDILARAYEPEEPWSFRDAIELVTGQDWTTWSQSDAAALLRFLTADEPSDNVIEGHYEENSEGAKA